MPTAAALPPSNLPPLTRDRYYDPSLIGSLTEPGVAILGFGVPLYDLQRTNEKPVWPCNWDAANRAGDFVSRQRGTPRDIDVDSHEMNSCYLASLTLSSSRGLGNCAAWMSIVCRAACENGNIHIRASPTLAP